METVPGSPAINLSDALGPRLPLADGETGGACQPVGVQGGVAAIWPCAAAGPGHSPWCGLAEDWMAQERFVIRGALGAATFVPWVVRHMGKLGLDGTFEATGTTLVELRVSGQPELIDALEMGVSLGPIEAWVESIERTPLNVATSGAEGSLSATFPGDDG